MPLIYFTIIPQGGPCDIPSLSEQLSICRLPEPSPTLNITVLNKAVYKQQKILPQLLGTTKNNRQLSYVVKEAESALHKFNNDIRRSNLPSKDHISAAVTTVIKKAKKAASDLQRFSSESAVITVKTIIFNQQMYLQLSNAAQQTPQINSPNGILDFAVQLANAYLSP